MSMARITSLDARLILDSRGAWTVEVALKLSDGRAVCASVPQGKSIGSHEARFAPPQEAARNVRKIIAPKLRGADPTKQKEIDDLLIRLDGTPNKERLGANAVLGVSIACARAGALARNVPLWKHIRRASGLRIGRAGGARGPRLFINMINGGLHAGTNLHIQEYLVIPRAKTMRESVEVGVKLYRALGERLQGSRGETSRNVGDEGGYAPRCKDDLEPLSLLQQTARALGILNAVDLGVDAAANNIRKKPAELAALYRRMRALFRLAYVEDPFGEDAFGDFAALTRAFGASMLIAGDDLTVTNIARMEKARAERAVNAVIIKPNQIGTVSEALRAAGFARARGWAVIASHRSGETNDDFIADFAYGVGADGFKLGAPARGERIAKYNRLLEISAAAGE